MIEMVLVMLAFGLMTVIRFWIPSCLRNKQGWFFIILSSLIWLLVSSILSPLLVFCLSSLQGSIDRTLSEVS